MKQVPIANADVETVTLSTHPRFLALIERSRVRQNTEGGSPATRCGVGWDWNPPWTAANGIRHKLGRHSHYHVWSGCRWR
jgi:hypothetical protein